MTMRRVQRDRLLTPEEAAKYRAIREKVAEELPDLVARHQDRMGVREQVSQVVKELKATREAKGLSLADVAHITGAETSALGDLENAETPNPTV